MVGPFGLRNDPPRHAAHRWPATKPRGLCPNFGNSEELLL